MIRKMTNDPVVKPRLTRASSGARESVFAVIPVLRRAPADA